jgi:hypothetical protein
MDEVDWEIDLDALYGSDANLASLMATEQEAVAQQRAYEEAEQRFAEQPRPHGAGGYR